MNYDKCNFMCQEMKYLGHVVSESGLKPDPDEIAVILDYLFPVTMKQLERFLNMVAWY